MIPLLRSPLVLAAALLCVLAFVPPAAAQHPGEVNFSEFYEALEPHGQWIEHPRWGHVWAPAAQRDEEWRPYSRGQWVYTDEHGWYWESEEEWGWGPYHYGRWFLDARYGWIWIPGRDWGPAWVAWRYSDDYVGWAPLPPDAAWDPDSGEMAYSYAAYEGPEWAPMWSFVPVAYIASPRVWRYCAPRARNVYFIGRSRYVPGYSVVNRRVFHRGLDVRLVERFSRRPVTRVQVRLIDNPRDGSWRRGGDRNVVAAYRPSLARSPNRPAFVPRTIPERAHVNPSGREGPAANGRFRQDGPWSRERSVQPRGTFDGDGRGALGGPTAPNAAPGNVPDTRQHPRFRQGQPGAGPGPGAPDGTQQPRFRQGQPGAPGAGQAGPARGPDPYRVAPQRHPGAVGQPPRQGPPVQAQPRQAPAIQAQPRQAAPQQNAAPAKQVNKGDPRKPDDKVR